MYTIKQAAARTGLTIPTIRAWERRYGVVSPERTEAGYRLYDEAAIERLAAMRSLVEREGWRPSQAADRIRTPGIDLASLARQATATGGSSGDQQIDSTGAARRSCGACLRCRSPAAGHRRDGAGPRRGLRCAAVRARDGRGCLPGAPCRRRAWADGTLDVAAEHAASETVRRRLARFFDAARGPMMQTRLLVGMPPGGDHELGVFAFAVACRRAGQAVAYIGSDVPLESWMRIVRETRRSRDRARRRHGRGRGCGQPGRRSHRDAGPPTGLFRRRSRAHRRDGHVGRGPAPPVPRCGRGRRRRRDRRSRSGPRPR